MDNQTPQQPTAPAKKLPMLGFIGLGLAVAGVILSFIPAILIIGVLVLMAAFIVSLVAIFKKDTVKWPSIVGLVLSFVGGIIASTVFIVALAVAISNHVNETTPTDSPSSVIEKQTNSTNDKTSSNRPSVDELAKTAKSEANRAGITQYDDIPGYYQCMARALYDSEISDESLQLIADADYPLESEEAVAGEITKKATIDCQSQ